ncbi:ankyrin [Imleria badia]|nr:ankyrin [Imleria badia]
MIRCLVENGFDALSRTKRGDTLLHIVIETADEDNVLATTKLLLAHGCDPLQPNHRCKMPIDIAAERGHVSVVHYLLSLGVPLPSDLINKLSWWVAKNRARMIRCLVENGFDVLSRSESGNTLLHIVIDSADEDGVLATTKFLLAHGYDPLQANPRNETPIHISIERGHIFLAHFLLSLGVALPSDALFIALYSPRLSEDSPRISEMVHFLIDQGANIFARQYNGDSVLHAAVIAFPDGDPDVLEVITSLVAGGCDPATSNTHGVTPLHVAVEQGNVKIVKHLISLNAPLPPDILFPAIESDSISSSQAMEVIQVLATSGCDTLTRNGAGHTPLYVATIRGLVSVVDYLLSSVNSSPSSEDFLSAAALAPPDVRSKTMSLLNGRHARSESPYGPDVPPTKRTKYS